LHQRSRYWQKYFLFKQLALGCLISSRIKLAALNVTAFSCGVPTGGHCRIKTLRAFALLGELLGVSMTAMRRQAIHARYGRSRASHCDERRERNTGEFSYDA